MIKIYFMVFLFSLSGCRSIQSNDLKNYSLSIPLLQKKSNERITKILVEVKGAAVCSINHVPFDWGVKLSPPISGVSKLEFMAGHGTSYISDPKVFDDFISIRMCEDVQNSYNISMIVSIDDYPNDDKEYRFHKDKIILKEIKN
jgi:hypothetical protein